MSASGAERRRISRFILYYYSLGPRVTPVLCIPQQYVVCLQLIHVQFVFLDKGSMLFARDHVTRYVPSPLSTSLLLALKYM